MFSLIPFVLEQNFWDSWRKDFGSALKIAFVSKEGTFFGKKKVFENLFSHFFCEHGQNRFICLTKNWRHVCQSYLFSSRGTIRTKLFIFGENCVFFNQFLSLTKKFDFFGKCLRTIVKATLKGSKSAFLSRKVASWQKKIFCKRFMIFCVGLLAFQTENCPRVVINAAFASRRTLRLK